MYVLGDVKFGLLLNYEDVLKKDRPNVIEEIKKMNLHKSLSIICELISVRNSKNPIHPVFGNTYEDVLKLKFFKDECANIQDFITLPFTTSVHHIISIQMLMILLKKFIAHGNYETFNDYNYTITEDDYKKIIKLNLSLVSDFEDLHMMEFDRDHFIYANYHFDSKRNLKNDLARMYFMIKLSRSGKSYFDDAIKNEFRDYYSKFQKEYNYTPIEYISLLSWEVLRLTSNEIYLSNRSIWRNVNDEYKNLKDNTRVDAILSFLTKSIFEYKKWAKDTQNNEWDFSQLLSHPFIKDCNNNYISISDVTVNNAIFGGLFNLIRECYPEDDKRAMSFFGRLFEIYISVLSSKCTSREYKFLEEFSVKSNKSSDAYIRKDDNLLVVEAKGIFPYFNSVHTKEKYKENNTRLFVNPIIQADEFLHKTQSLYFQDVENYYIISLTLDNVNAVPKYYNQIHDIINKSKKCKKTKFYFNFNIEEYEMLMALLEQGNDIFTLLEEYFNNNKLKSFLSYMLEKYPNLKRAKFIDELFSEFIIEMKEVLGIKI